MCNIGWAKYIIGKISEWLDFDSTDNTVRVNSELVKIQQKKKKKKKKKKQKKIKKKYLNGLKKKSKS